MKVDTVNISFVESEGRTQGRREWLVRGRRLDPGIESLASASG